MQHIIFTLLLLILSPAWGEAPLSQNQLAQELSPYQSIKNLKAHFDQTRKIDRWNTEIKTSGNFHLNQKQGQSILWEILTPEYSAIKISSEGLAMNSNKLNPQWIVVNNAQIKNQIEPLFAWLHFDAAKISQQYDVYSAGKEAFKLIPKNKKSPLQSIFIQGKKGKIQQVILKEQTNDTIDILFSKVTTTP